MYDLPDARGHFGPYGGVFVAETLTARAGRAARRLRARAQRSGVPGRVPLRAQALRRAPEPGLSRQAAVGAAAAARRSTSSARTSTTPARTRSTTPSARRCSRAAWASRASSPRPAPACTASPPPRSPRATAWNAWSTWAPRTSSARRPNVYRMKLLGAKVVPVESGSKTLKDALNEAMRDWVTNVDSTFYIIGTVAGPHPVSDDGARLPVA